MFPSVSELLETVAVHESSLWRSEVRAADVGFRLGNVRKDEMRSLYEMHLHLLFVFQWMNILPLLKRSTDTIWSR